MVQIARYSRPPVDPDAEGPGNDAGHDDLPALGPAVRLLHELLGRLGYAPELHEDLDGPALRAVVLDRLPGARIVYVGAHGTAGDGDRVDIVPSRPDLPSGTNVTGWVNDAQEFPAPTLFLLDLCHAGQAARPVVHRPDRPAKAWVMAACTSGQQAFDARFTYALADVVGDVVRNGLDTDPARPFVRFSEVARRVRILVENSPGYVQNVACTAMDVAAEEPELPFFPNLRFDPSRTAVSQVEPPLRVFLAEQDARHFEDKAGAYFTGRADEMSTLAAWLDDPTGGPTLRVVTGVPGVGKSAVLGALACAAHPDLVDASPAVRDRLFTTDPFRCPAKAPAGHLAAVHARGRTASEVLASLARQTGLQGEPTTADDAIGLLLDSRVTPTVIVDALDEATAPAEVCAALVHLATARRPDGGPVLRLLVGTRRWDQFATLLDAASEGGGLIDLDTVDPVRVRGDIARFLTTLLTHTPGYDRTKAVCTAVATAAADALIPEVPSEWGAYLVSTVFARYLRTAPVPPDVPAAVALGGAIPTSLPAVLDLELAAHPQAREIRAVLTALAQARGEGMPLEVALPLAARFAPGLTDEQAREALAEALFYVRATPGPNDVLHYRLFHQGLADHLKQQGSQAVSPSQLLEHLLARHTATLDGVRTWSTTPDYLLRHVFDHAEDADGLDEILSDPELLVHADPRAMATAFNRTTAIRARETGAVYMSSVGRAEDLDAASRRFTLATHARRQGRDTLADALSRGLPWHPAWSTVRHIGPLNGLVVVTGEGTRSLACATRDGRDVVVTGHSDGMLKVWDPYASNAERWQTQTPISRVVTVACEQVDGSWVAAAGGPDGVVFYDLENGRQFEARIDVVVDTFDLFAWHDLEGRPVLLTGFAQDLLTAWDPLTGEPLQTWNVNGAARQYAVDLTLGTGLAARFTYVRETAIPRSHRLDMARSPSVPVGLAYGRWPFHDDPSDLAGRTHHRSHPGAGSRLFVDVLDRIGSGPFVTASAQGDIQAWDVTSREPAGAPMTGHRHEISHLEILTVDGRPAVVSGGDDGSIRVWDLRHQEPMCEPCLAHAGRVLDLDMMPGDDHVVASLGSDGTVRLWDLRTHPVIAGDSLETASRTHDIEYVAWVEGAQSGTDVVASGTYGTGFTWGSTPGGGWRQRESAAEMVVLCGGSDGRFVARGDGIADDSVGVVEAGTGRIVGRDPVADENEAVRCAARGVFGGTKVLAVGTDSGNAYILSEDEGLPLIRTLQGDGDDLTAVAFVGLASGAGLVSVSDAGAVRVWDLESVDPDPVRTVPTGGTWKFGFGEVNGRAVAVLAGMYELRILDIESGEFGPGRHHEFSLVTSVACGSVDGLPVAVTGSFDSHLTIWDLVSGARSVWPMPGPVNSVDLSSSGSILVGCGSDVIVLEHHGEAL